MYMEAIALTPTTTTISFDRQTLVNLYEQHSPGLYRYAYRMLGDSHLAEDCVSETYSRFLQAIRSGRGPTENVQAYLYRVAHNWITDHYRRQPLPYLELEEDQHIDPLGNPAQAVSQRMDQDRVRAALLRLPPEQRQVIELRFLEDWSHEQVADVMGKTVEATRALQYRALAALKRLLIDAEEG